jgi:dUTP pyrophosphatase
MNTCTIRIANVSGNPLPHLQSQGAAGVDLYADLPEPMVIEPRKVYAVPTGISIELPAGYEAQIRARSGLALKQGITLVNGIGTIDSDYRGEIKVILTKLTDGPYTIAPGDRIAQMVIAQYCAAEFIEVDSPEDLSDTQRAAGGFGHSGV